MPSCTQTRIRLVATSVDPGLVDYLAGHRLFDALYEKYPKLGRRVLEEVDHIVRRSRRTIMRLTLTPVTARVASFLISIPDARPQWCPGDAR